MDFETEVDELKWRTGGYKWDCRCAWRGEAGSALDALDALESTCGETLTRLST